MCRRDDGRAPRGCGELEIRAEQSLLIHRRHTGGMNEYSSQTEQEGGIQGELRASGALAGKVLESPQPGLGQRTASEALSWGRRRCVHPLALSLVSPGL